MATYIHTSDVTLTAPASQIVVLLPGDSLIVTREATLVAAGAGTVVVRATNDCDMQLNGEMISLEQVIHGSGDLNVISVGPDGYLAAVGPGFAAIELENDFNSVFNAGHIDSRLNAVQIDGLSSNVTNTGQMTGGGAAVLIAGSGGAVTNTGVMAGGSWGVRLIGDANLVVNSGTIAGVISGAEGLSFKGNGNFLRNSGEISGMDDDALQIVGDARSANRIVNSGLMAASSPSPLFYAVAGDAGEETVINTGMLFGGVRLGAGNDMLDTRRGSAVGALDMGDGNDRMLGSAGDDLALGGAGADHLKGFDGHDELFGGDRDDKLLGGTGDDTLDGGDGRDTLTGGAGDDLLTGGLSIDAFVFRPGLGHDVVADFVATGVLHDTIVFSRALFSSFAQIGANMSQEGPDVLIKAGGDTIVLQNVLLGDLDATDFAFVA